MKGERNTRVILLSRCFLAQGEVLTEWGCTVREDGAVFLKTQTVLARVAEQDGILEPTTATPKEASLPETATATLANGESKARNEEKATDAKSGDDDDTSHLPLGTDRKVFELTEVEVRVDMCAFPFMGILCGQEDERSEPTPEIVVQRSRSRSSDLARVRSLRELRRGKSVPALTAQNEAKEPAEGQRHRAFARTPT